MATTVLTLAQLSTFGALKGVNVDPATYYDWSIKSSVPAALTGDVIETPVFDLNAINPKCNRLVLQKSLSANSADLFRLQISADGVNWFTAPLYNGAPSASIAVGNQNTNELALVGLPAMRYVKGQLTLATDMSVLTAARISISFMRY